MKAQVNPGGGHGGTSRGSSPCDFCLIFGLREPKKWLSIQTPIQSNCNNSGAMQGFFFPVWIVDDQPYLKRLISKLLLEGFLCQILDVGFIWTLIKHTIMPFILRELSPFAWYQLLVSTNLYPLSELSLFLSSTQTKNI